MVEFNITGDNLHPNPLDIYTWASQFNTTSGMVLSSDSSIDPSPAGGTPLKVAFGDSVYSGSRLESYNTSNANITAIEPGQSYRLSVYIKADSNTTIDFNAVPANSNSFFLPESGVVQQFSIGTSWTLCTIDITCNDAASAYLQTWFRFETSQLFAQVWFDGFQIHKLSQIYDVVEDVQYANRGYTLYSAAPTTFYSFHGLTFKPDGTSFVSYNAIENAFYQVDLDTPWDINSAVFRNKILSLNNLSTSDPLYYQLNYLFRFGSVIYDSEITDLRFNSDGTRLIFVAWIAWTNESRLFSLKLNTPYVITSCDLTGTSSSAKGHLMVNLFEEIPDFPLPNEAGYVYSTFFFNQSTGANHADGGSFVYLKHINNSPVWQYVSLDNYNISDIINYSNWSTYDLTGITGSVPLLSSSDDLADDYRDGPKLYARQYYNSVYLFARNSEIYSSEQPSLPIYRIDTNEFAATATKITGEFHRGNIEDFYIDFNSSKMFALDATGFIYEYNITKSQIVSGFVEPVGPEVEAAPPAGGDFDSDDPSYSIASVLAADSAEAGALVDSAENEVDFAFPISMDAANSKIEFTNTSLGGGGYEFNYSSGESKFQLSGINGGNQIFSVQGNTFSLGLEGSEYGFPTAKGTNGQFLQLNSSGILEFVDISFTPTIITFSTAGIGDGPLLFAKDPNYDLIGGATEASLRYQIASTTEGRIYQGSAYAADPNNELSFVNSTSSSTSFAALRSRFNGGGTGSLTTQSNASSNLYSATLGSSYAGRSSSLGAVSSASVGSIVGQTQLSGSQSEGLFALVTSSTGTYLNIEISDDTLNRKSNFDIVGGGTAKLSTYTDTSNGSYISLSPTAGVYLVVEDTGVEYTYNLRDNGWYVSGASAFAIRDDLDVYGSIDATGDITAFSNTSDITLKENIEKINDALNKVNKLSGYTFNYKERPEERHTGLIAQEVMEVLPEVVYDKGDGIYALRYGNVVGLLVEAIKELSAKVEELENR